MNKSYMISGSYGNITVDMNGVILSKDLDESGEYDNIQNFNVLEYIKARQDSGLWNDPKAIDIVDIGYIDLDENGKQVYNDPEIGHRLHVFYNNTLWQIYNGGHSDSKVKTMKLNALEIEREIRKDHEFYADLIEDSMMEEMEGLELENPTKKSFRVWAKMTTYCYIDVKANDQDQAETMAKDMDGGDFISTDDGDWEIVSSLTEEK